MIRRLLRELRDYPPHRRLKWRKERAKRGFSGKDWWSFDDYLAKVIAAGCREFIAHGHGFPMFPEESEAIEKAIETGKKSDYETLGPEGIARWNVILDEIAKGFEVYGHEGGYPADGAENEASFKRGMELFSQYFPNLWD